MKTLTHHISNMNVRHLPGKIYEALKISKNSQLKPDYNSNIDINKSSYDNIQDYILAVRDVLKKYNNDVIKYSQRLIKTKTFSRASEYVMKVTITLKNDTNKNPKTYNMSLPLVGQYYRMHDDKIVVFLKKEEDGSLRYDHQLAKYN